MSSANKEIADGGFECHTCAFNSNCSGAASNEKCRRGHGGQAHAAAECLERGGGDLVDPNRFGPGNPGAINDKK